MSVITNFWGGVFNVATQPTRFSYNCLTAQPDGDYDVTPYLLFPVGVLTIIPSLLITAALLPAALGIGLLGTLCILLGNAIKAVSDCVDNTLAPSF
ncbi:hypothetical protein [Legionella worsleiensis]|uniref:Transmembrane protein n=1 Tax=Legionella worsleiensis TaxID=45076 RepID=A0A0W1AIP4_9GAMM|nr:hypothetical protein [Legionella worsleiensis]KTD81161.1 hypothetical protein Lwor_0839 [Legionella worsleiensis]STY33136.1 Uncharacterised protein [Legionella worsleiensis]